MRSTRKNVSRKQVSVRKLDAYPVYLILSGASTLFNATMFTVLTVYYVTAVGMNPLQLVLVGTVLEITEFVFEIPTGVIADIFSRRLSVIIGMFVTGAAFVLIGIVPRFEVVLLGQVIYGIGATFISGAREAWIADEVGEENLSRVFVRTGQVRRICALIGAFVSVGLASISIGLPLALGGALTMALGVFLIIYMPEHGFQPTPRTQRTSWTMLAASVHEGVHVVRGRPLLLTLLLVGVFGGAASEGFDRLGDAHLLTFSFPALGSLKPVVWFGIIDAASKLVGMVAVTILGRRIEAISLHPVAIARALLLLQAFAIASIIAFGLAGNFGVAVAALLAKVALEALAEPLSDTWFIQNIDPKVRATVLSLSSLTDAFGQATGGPVLGAIGSVFSLRAAMVATGVALMPALALYRRALRQTQTA